VRKVSCGSYHGKAIMGILSWDSYHEKGIMDSYHGKAIMERYHGLS